MKQEQYGVVTGLTGEYAGRRLRMNANETLWFGSDSRNNAVLRGENISPLHCGISCDPENNCFWVACESEFGVLVDGVKRLRKGMEVRLTSGTRIQIGSYLFELSCAGAVQESGDHDNSTRRDFYRDSSKNREYETSEPEPGYPETGSGKTHITSKHIGICCAAAVALLFICVTAAVMINNGRSDNEDTEYIYVESELSEISGEVTVSSQEGSLETSNENNNKEMEFVGDDIAAATGSIVLDGGETVSIALDSNGFSEGSQITYYYNSDDEYYTIYRYSDYSLYREDYTWVSFQKTDGVVDYRLRYEIYDCDMTDEKLANELASYDLLHQDDLVMGDIRTVKWNSVTYKYFMATHLFDRVYNEDDYCCDAHYCAFIVWWEQEGNIVSASLNLCIETELGGSVSWPEPGSDLLIYMIGAVEGSEFYSG